MQLDITNFIKTGMIRLNFHFCNNSLLRSSWAGRFWSDDRNERNCPRRFGAGLIIFSSQFFKQFSFRSVPSWPVCTERWTPFPQSTSSAVSLCTLSPLKRVFQYVGLFKNLYNLKKSFLLIPIKSFSVCPITGNQIVIQQGCHPLLNLKSSREVVANDTVSQFTEC